MSEPYLILHKVRGEPAFDIAEKIGEDSDGDIWIIPTSGHRAYPYWNMPLPSTEHNGKLLFALGQTIYQDVPHMPPDWPDHYSCNDRPLREDTYTVQRKAAGLLESLGLVKRVTVERRD